MPSLTLSLSNLTTPDGEDEYEIEVASFSVGSAPTRDDPGDGGEVEMGDVTVKRHGSDKWEKVADSVLFEHYVVEYDLKDDQPTPGRASYLVRSALQKANEAITEKLFERCYEYYEDDGPDPDDFHDD